MGDLFLLSERQMARISPHSRCRSEFQRADDRRVVSGIIYMIHNGLQWKDAVPMMPWSGLSPASGRARQ